ncbi:hypothetical protein JW968_03055 [Candidatus Woesearchaeota archaeon]|nr:hypothetical protein [Candidatus Woesearchaeota archaeon]
MKKRGVTQIDWVISLSIFLLFLTLFFIYARPSLFTTREVTDYTGLVLENLKAETFTQVREYPILISSEEVQQHAAILIDYPFQTGEALLENIQFVTDEGKLIFIDNLPQGYKTRKLTLSDRPITVQGQERLLQFHAEENETRTGKSIINYLNSNLRLYSYNGNPVITDFRIQINNADIIPESTGFASSSIHSKYKMTTSIFDHSNIMTAENDGIYGIIKAKSPHESKMMRIKIKAKSYPNYYFDNSEFGSFNETECIMKTDDYLNLHGGGALSIKFTKEVDYTVCGGEETDIYIDFNLNDTEYKIAVFEDDEHVPSGFEHHHAWIGHEERYTLLDPNKLGSMNESYEEMKSRWAYQRNKEFDIQVLSSTGATVFSTGQEPYQMAQVNSKRVLAKTLPDEIDGEKKDYYILIMTW